MKKVCKHCEEFFKRYSCAKTTIGECDCPKCVGYCECYLLEAKDTVESRYSGGPGSLVDETFDDPAEYDPYDEER